MRVISLTNLKGGSSKSTTTFNLAGALVEAGYSVLCIDMDPQMTLGEAFFGVYANQHQTLSSVLIDDGMIGSIAQSTRFQELEN